MFLLNSLNGRKLEVEICERRNHTPVLLISGRKVFPQEVQDICRGVRILYATNRERKALERGGYRIPNAPEKQLRIIE